MVTMVTGEIVVLKNCEGSFDKIVRALRSKDCGYSTWLDEDKNLISIFSQQIVLIKEIPNPERIPIPYGSVVYQ